MLGGMAAETGFSSRQKLTLLATSVGLFMIYLETITPQTRTLG